jgi:SAM-dependent methyltransferase
MSWLLAGIYDRFMARTEAVSLGAWRTELLGSLEGHIVEIGAGTGVNLAHYGDGPESLALCEPDRGMRRQLEARLPTHGRARALAAGAERLPFEDGTVDVVVGTLVFCTVPEPARALAEARRILKPGGRLVFLEHVAAPDGTRDRRTQGWVDPVWRHLAGGCRLVRDTEAAIRAAGFDIERLERAPMKPAPRFVRPTIRGVARR